MDIDTAVLQNVFDSARIAKAATITFAERAETSPVDSSEPVLSHISGKVDSDAAQRSYTNRVCQVQWYKRSLGSVTAITTF